MLVGVNFAKALSLARSIPLIGVHHIEGHVAALWIDDGPEPPIELPATVLVVSGGHTELIQVEQPGVYRFLGGTIDDAAGEAFDKGARLLELGYPGGPAIQKAAECGDERAIPFPRAWLDDSLNFSFSGLKTALLRLTKPFVVADQNPPPAATPQGFAPHVAKQFTSDFPVSDLAAGFQFAIVDVLVEKTDSGRPGKRFAHHWHRRWSCRQSAAAGPNPDTNLRSSSGNCCSYPGLSVLHR